MPIFLYFRFILIVNEINLHVRVFFLTSPEFYIIYSKHSVPGHGKNGEERFFNRFCRGNSTNLTKLMFRSVKTH
jgi:hypothetical protein